VHFSRDLKSWIKLTGGPNRAMAVHHGIELGWLLSTFSACHVTFTTISCSWKSNDIAQMIIFKINLFVYVQIWCPWLKCRHSEHISILHLLAHSTAPCTAYIQFKPRGNWLFQIPLETAIRTEASKIYTSVSVHLISDNTLLQSHHWCI